MHRILAPQAGEVVAFDVALEKLGPAHVDPVEGEAVGLRGSGGRGYKCGHGGSSQMASFSLLSNISIAIEQRVNMG